MPPILLLLLAGAGVAYVVATKKPAGTPTPVPLPLPGPGGVNPPLPPIPPIPPSILPQVNPGFLSPGEAYEFTFADAMGRTPNDVETSLSIAGWDLTAGRFMSLGPLGTGGGTANAYYAYAQRKPGSDIVPFSAEGNAGLTTLALLQIRGPTWEPTGPAPVMGTS
jgi:hypothetical protein